MLAPPPAQQMQNILALVPKHLRGMCREVDQLEEQLQKEVLEDYDYSLRKSIGEEHYLNTKNKSLDTYREI